jgi:hypothetical protein
MTRYHEPGTSNSSDNPQGREGGQNQRGEREHKAGAIAGLNTHTCIYSTKQRRTTQAHKAQPSTAS